MKELLLRAAEEIAALRRRNEVLEAKVEVMDLFGSVFKANPPQRGGMMAVDVHWELKQAIFKHEAAEKAATILAAAAAVLKPEAS